MKATEQMIIEESPAATGDELADTGSATERLAGRLALAGLALYCVFAPHSIAGAWIGLSCAILGWLGRAVITRRPFLLRRSALDLPLWLLFGWSVLSSALSFEPRISLLKLASVAAFLVCYVAQGLVTRRNAIWLAGLLVASGVAGVLWSAGELARGRGVCVEEFAVTSPLRRLETPLMPGDCVWRVNRRRISTVAEIDDAIRRAPDGSALSFSVITRGEHVEWDGPLMNQEMRSASSPSGITRDGGPTHRFRASGWTRHYETHAEVLQIIAQLALGLALAHWQRRRLPDHRQQPPDSRQPTDSPPAPSARRRQLVPFLAGAGFTLLAVGVAFTAMRTTLVALACGAAVVAWRAVAAGGGQAKESARQMNKARLAVAVAVALVLAFGAFAVWRTRPDGALRFGDFSSQLRWQVARTAAARVPLRPLVGHGMDASKYHWREWGFEGPIIHTHSTPIQLAFERGLPALAFWLWLAARFWLLVTRAERGWRASADAGTHGLLLGATGAFAGFFLSSLVNYNLGDAEVALLVWWLMGMVVSVSGQQAGSSVEPGNV
ncbi:MAG: O-antigen ligase family protein [Pyrinomonadaceae bacterium]